MALLGRHGADLVFVPATEELYPPGDEARVDVGSLARPWEGQCRPGHFEGVATVVLKLFLLAQPDVAFFGRKDYQQTLVVRQLVKDFLLPIEIRVCPTIREPDGLALSSRNRYLTADERQRGLALSRARRLAAELVRQKKLEPAGDRRADEKRIDRRRSDDRLCRTGRSADARADRTARSTDGWAGCRPRGRRG